MNKQEEQKIREEFDKDMLWADGTYRHEPKYLKDFLISKIKQREEEIMQTAFRFDTEQFNSYDDYKDTIIRNTNR